MVENYHNINPTNIIFTVSTCRVLHISCHTLLWSLLYPVVFFRRITEIFRLGKTAKIPSPAVHPSLPCSPLNNVSTWHTHTPFEHILGWRIPGQPGPICGNPFSEEVFSNIPLKHPLVQQGGHFLVWNLQMWWQPENGIFKRLKISLFLGSLCSCNSERAFYPVSLKIL